jgi:adenylate kinase
MRKRLDVYERQTSPLIDYYINAGLLRAIPGDGNIDIIQSLIVEALEGNV